MPACIWSPLLCTGWSASLSSLSPSPSLSLIRFQQCINSDVKQTYRLHQKYHTGTSFRCGVTVLDAANWVRFSHHLLIKNKKKIQREAEDNWEHQAGICGNQRRLFIGRHYTGVGWHEWNRFTPPQQFWAKSHQYRAVMLPSGQSLKILKIGCASKANARQIQLVPIRINAREERKKTIRKKLTRCFLFGRLKFKFDLS